MEQFYRDLIQKGYKTIPINVSNLLVFSKEEESLIYVAVIYPCIQGVVYSKEQMYHINQQVEHFFCKFQKTLRMMFFLFTQESSMIKDYLTTGENIAIVDVVQRRLILYDYVSDYGQGIFQELERELQDSIQTKGSYKKEKNNFTVPWVTCCLVIVNILIFVFLEFSGKYQIATVQGALFWPAVKDLKEYYRLFTSMFLHANISHLLNNMLILSVIGNTLEKAIGPIKYISLYLISGILAGVASFSYNMINQIYSSSIGASGAIFGVIGAMLFVILYGETKIQKIGKKQIILFAILSLYRGFTSTGIDNVAHVGGLIGGFFLAFLLCRNKRREEVIR